MECRRRFLGESRVWGSISLDRLFPVCYTANRMNTWEGTGTSLAMRYRAYKVQDSMDTQALPPRAVARVSAPLRYLVNHDQKVSESGEGDVGRVPAGRPQGSPPRSTPPPPLL